jgi:capsular polysaccharide transport system permease protein
LGTNADLSLAHRSAIIANLSPGGHCCAAAMGRDFTGIQHEMIRPSKFRNTVKDRLFVFVVLLPFLLSVLYFGFLASDIYISESKFVLRSPEKPAASGLGVILKSAGFTNAGDEIYAAQTYAASRDALHAINRNNAFEQAYSRPQISLFDRFNPFGNAGSFESLYKYFQGKVRLQNDTTTSITTLTVRAYTPQDARKFNEALLQLSESTVNQLNQRGRQDLIGYAEKEVDDAKALSLKAALAIAAYRNRIGVVDPEKQATAQMSMVAKLQDGLIAAKTELAQLQRYTPDNPRIPIVQTQLSTIQGEIDREMGKVAGNRGSLAASAVRYQRLVLESTFADKQLGAALSSLEQARSESLRKQAYVERIVEPNLADAPMEPRRLRGMLATLAVALVAYGILKMLLAGVREHGQ